MENYSLFARDGEEGLLAVIYPLSQTSGDGKCMNFGVLFNCAASCCVTQGNLCNFFLDSAFLTVENHIYLEGFMKIKCICNFSDVECIPFQELHKVLLTDVFASF